MIAPEVPVTVNVTWDPACGVWAPEELPHPTAISENRTITTRNPKILVDRILPRVSGFRLEVVKTVASSPRPGNTPPKIAA